MEIRNDLPIISGGLPTDIVKIVWQGGRIAKLVFGSGMVIDFTKSEALGQVEAK